MNYKNFFLTAIISSTVVFPGLAISADNEASSSASVAKTDKDKPADKKAVRAHNHMRDSKGMWVPPKSEAKDDAAKPDSAPPKGK